MQVGGDWRISRYDLEHGLFTQQDPIGIAGGANVYGFAGGDPIAYSDPFGLYVITAEGSEARRLFQQLKNSASAMSKSSDGQKRDAGIALSQMLARLENAPDTIKIFTHFPKTATGALTTEGVGYGVNVRASQFPLVDPIVLLAHELGHAHRIVIDGKGTEGLSRAIDALLDRVHPSELTAMRYENAARTLMGCAARTDANRATPCK